jgi:hypothetical protein
MIGIAIRNHNTHKDAWFSNLPPALSLRPFATARHMIRGAMRRELADMAPSSVKVVRPFSVRRKDSACKGLRSSEGRVATFLKSCPNSCRDCRQTCLDFDV